MSLTSSCVRLLPFVVYLTQCRIHKHPVYRKLEINTHRGHVTSLSAIGVITPQVSTSQNEFFLKSNKMNMYIAPTFLPVYLLKYGVWKYEALVFGEQQNANEACDLLYKAKGGLMRLTSSPLSSPPHHTDLSVWHIQTHYLESCVPPRTQILT